MVAILGVARPAQYGGHPTLGLQRGEVRKGLARPAQYLHSMVARPVQYGGYPCR